LIENDRALMVVDLSRSQSKWRKTEMRHRIYIADRAT
jgi:hypothetical protein